MEKGKKMEKRKKRERGKKMEHGKKMKTKIMIEKKTKTKKMTAKMMKTKKTMTKMTRMKLHLHLTTLTLQLLHQLGCLPLGGTTVAPHTTAFPPSSVISSQPPGSPARLTTTLGTTPKPPRSLRPGTLETTWISALRSSPGRGGRGTEETRLLFSRTTFT